MQTMISFLYLVPMFHTLFVRSKYLIYTPSITHVEREEVDIL